MTLSSKTSIKIVQLNTWEGRLARGLLRFVERERPDIMCLQEVFCGGAHVRFPDRMCDILERIVSMGDYGHVYFSPRYRFDAAGAQVEVGNAIVSQFPFMSEKTVWIEGDGPQCATTTITYVENITNLQIARVRTPQGPLYVANHHGHHVGSKHVTRLVDTSLGDDMSVAMMQKVAEKLRKVDGPLVFCGDLNVSSDSPSMRCFDGWMQDMVVTAKTTTTLSHLNVDRDIACDHMLVNASVNVRRFSVASDIVSDHFPLVAELDIW